MTYLNLFKSDRQQRVAGHQECGVETISASSPSAMDLSDAPPDVITVLLGNMSLEQRAACAAVCSGWPKTAAATTHSIVKQELRHLNGLQQWLEKHGSQVETMQLHVDCPLDMARLSCTHLRDLLLHGKHWGCKLTLGSGVWSDVAAATKLTSVSLQWVCTDFQQAAVVSALTVLPNLQQLTWRAVQCGQEQELSNSRLVQQLTKLASLDIGVMSAEALQHLGSLSKLQRLSISVLSGAPVWIATNCPGLQQLTRLTSLQLGYNLEGLPSAVSHLTALQQLEVCEATTTELNNLKALTALTKLRIKTLRPDTTPLQLPTLHTLNVGASSLSGGDNVLHTSQLSSCTQLRRLSLQRLDLVGPDSLAANSMLQELWVEDCSLSSPEGPAGVDPWQLVFPGPGRLPRLTSAVLWSVFPPPQQADLERLVACCSGLRRLKVCASLSSWSLTSASAFKCLPRLGSLVFLHLTKATDQQCRSLARLTGLRHLRIAYLHQISSGGLRHLAGLQQLTNLNFWGAFDSRKVNDVLQAQLSDTFRGKSRALVNKAPPGSPPDVSARLLRACDMAAEAAAAALAPQPSSALKT